MLVKRDPKAGEEGRAEGEGEEERKDGEGGERRVTAEEKGVTDMETDSAAATREPEEGSKGRKEETSEGGQLGKEGENERGKQGKRGKEGKGGREEGKGGREFCGREGTIAPGTAAAGSGLGACMTCRCAASLDLVLVG